VLPSLMTGTGYSVRVASVPPVLPSEVLAILPAAAPLAYVPLGASGCPCVAVVSGAGCATVSGGSTMVTPQRPVVSTYGIDCCVYVCVWG
jgi:hypothetical protein